MERYRAPAWIRAVSGEKTERMCPGKNRPARVKPTPSASVTRYITERMLRMEAVSPLPQYWESRTLAPLATPKVSTI